jgi:transposase
MEACGGAHHWGREFIKQGHTVKLIAAKFVRPYVKNNKNDARDAEAICEAMSRPRIHFIPVKTFEQHDIQSLHRVRQNVQQMRIAQSNQIRGLLMEYGVVIPKGPSYVRKLLPLILEDAENNLTTQFRFILSELYDDLCSIDKRLERIDKQIAAICAENHICNRLTEIVGIGNITATAIYAAAGNGRQFPKGRLFSAWLGLVPRQHSSGGRELMLGISKHGNNYIRTLLVNGAQALLVHCERKNDVISKWLIELKKRRGHNKACIACANKLARICWAIMSSDQKYSPKEHLEAA